MSRREKVLLVDDEPRLLTALSRRLSGRFSIEMATSGAEALRTLETVPDIAVIVADMRMPEMSGAELLARVRVRWPDVRRIMLTGNTDQETAIAAVNEGQAFRVFNKPVDAALLADALHAAIEEYRFTTDSKSRLQRLKTLAASGEQTRKAFLAMMNHELRTPLNHILGFSALLELRCKQKGELESLEYISYIRESGQSLLRLINRIMEIVRMTAGEVRREGAVADLTEVLQQELAHFRPLAAQRNITIGCNATDEPLPVNAGEHELAQALAELLDNAIKFNRSGGHVAVAVTSSGDDVALRIADSGVGMADDEIRRVLGAFRQQDDGLNRRFEGAGVGLTLAALTAKTYGGDLAIESRKDHGTVVVMRFKRASAASQLAPDRLPRRASGA